MRNNAEYLSALVDGEIVKAVYLVKAEEGVIASWPPEEGDYEIETIADLTAVPQRDGLFFVIGGDRLHRKYFGIVIKDSILLFRVGKEMYAEKIAERLSKTYLLFRHRNYRNSGGNKR
ncbi:MAG: hypothetical protein GU347_00990 [Desulfurococcales archaeon]|jgi:hypothetical protein|uniref:Uncharacterized protein n=1 Tax=Fervidicoccus fontis TaxID=683846 RepID=A0A7J3SJ94_9CREN|nr:hypothetical protein [Thermoprotei archaeon]NAY89287.1 hypothetical protein [Desulfurococcales archaeon]